MFPSYVWMKNNRSFSFQCVGYKRGLGVLDADAMFDAGLFQFRLDGHTVQYVPMDILLLGIDEHDIPPNLGDALNKVRPLPFNFNKATLRGETEPMTEPTFN